MFLLQGVADKTAKLLRKKVFKKKILNVSLSLITKNKDSIKLKNKNKKEFTYLSQNGQWKEKCIYMTQGRFMGTKNYK